MFSTGQSCSAQKAFVALSLQQERSSGFPPIKRQRAPHRVARPDKRATPSGAKAVHARVTDTGHPKDCLQPSTRAGLHHYCSGSAVKLRGGDGKSHHEGQDTPSIFGRHVPILHHCLQFSQELLCNSNPEELSGIRRTLNARKQNEWTFKRIILQK